MKRLLFFLVSLVGLTMWADTAPDAALTRLMRYIRNVETFNRVFPQEKVYLHLDNTGYFMGDSIWWKAYVVRTDSGRLSNLSRVLYVELVDPFGNVLELQKRPIEGGQAYGNLKMRKSLSDGFYEIRAYTRYMTNWDATGIYSRVVPVFQRPTEEGAYGEMKINRTFDDFRRQTYYMPDSLTRRERRSWRKDPPPEVTFYPEGGHLVRGLQSTVAFQVACKDTAAPDVTARLVDSRGDTISYLPTVREGRGLLVCTPDTARLRLCVPMHGQMYTFPLPTAEDTGCVLTVGATAPRTIPVEVAASPSLQGRLLGLSLMHGGNVLAFDTVRPGAEPAVRLFERADLPPGVHQLTLFDERGRIWAERLFFIAPPQAGGALPVEARFADNLIAPYRKMQLTLRGQPGTTLSLSVMDADATPTGHQANAATWLLLASELQGYVRDAAYYLEADDAAHRSATDLLMRVQGWRRYDWRMMSGNAPFVKRQPVEDSLYLYGRVEPRQLYGGGIFSTKRTRARAKQVDHVELSATLYNQQGYSMRGHTVTDSAGYYAFALPPCEGEWALLLSTRRDGKRINFRPTVDRLFSPEKKLYSYYETELLPLPQPRDYFRPDAPPTATAATEPSDIRLGTATVREKKPFEGKRDWEVSRRVASQHSHIHYDMDAIAEQYYDHGEEQPFIGTWLLQNPAIAAEYAKGRPVAVYVGLDGLSAILEPRVTDGWNHDDFPNRRVNDKQLEDLIAIDESELNNKIPKTLDEIREVYVTLDDEYVDLMYLRDLNHRHPIHVFVYPHYTFWRKAKGQRRTYFQAYNRPSTFRMTNYDILPPTTDFRRTLYWNPNVGLDAQGEATVEFWNNSRCDHVYLSIEGITPEGRPQLYR